MLSDLQFTLFEKTFCLPLACTKNNFTESLWTGESQPRIDGIPTVLLCLATSAPRVENALHAARVQKLHFPKSTRRIIIRTAQSPLLFARPHYLDVKTDTPSSCVVRLQCPFLVLMSTGTFIDEKTRVAFLLSFFFFFHKQSYSVGI